MLPEYTPEENSPNHNWEVSCELLQCLKMLIVDWRILVAPVWSSQILLPLSTTSWPTWVVSNLIHEVFFHQLVLVCLPLFEIQNFISSNPQDARFIYITPFVKFNNSMLSIIYLIWQKKFLSDETLIIRKFIM